MRCRGDYDFTKGWRRWPDQQAGRTKRYVIESSHRHRRGKPFRYDLCYRHRTPHHHYWDERVTMINKKDKVSSQPVIENFSHPATTSLIGTRPRKTEMNLRWFNGTMTLYNNLHRTMENMNAPTKSSYHEMKGFYQSFIGEVYHSEITSVIGKILCVNYGKEKWLWLVEE